MNEKQIIKIMYIRCPACGMLKSLSTVIDMKYNKFNVESSKYRNEIEKNNAPLNSHLL